MAAVAALAAALLVVAGDVNPLAASGHADAVVGNVPPCCVEIVAVAPTALSPAPSGGQSSVGLAPGQLRSASRWRVVERDIKQLLPVGVAREQGLQVKTILAARSISAAFPEIHNMGGVRPDALRWHPDGLALDVMIPNAGTVEGIALGNEIVAFALKNAVRFGLQDAIWRGIYYTPSGARATGGGHFDHVHITTTGGGYPTGNEIYVR